MKRTRTQPRRLHCERLEERALLATLIGSLELPPSPIEVVRDHARAFIDTAFENLGREPRESPIDARITSEKTETLD